MKILFLTTILPRQKRMGSEVASQCYIDALTHLGHQVTVVGYMRQDDVFETSDQEVVVDTRYIETKKAKFYPFIWFILGLLKKLPYSAAKYYSRKYIRTVKRLIAEEEYHLVVLDHSQLGWLANYLPPKVKIISNTHNIEHELYLDIYQQANTLLSQWTYYREAKLIKKMENQLATIAHEVWTLTKEDAKYFASVVGETKVRVLSLPPALQQTVNKQLHKTCDIGIIGSWLWKPSQEGLLWFLKHVYPHLPKNISIQIAGRGAQWLTDQYPQISYLGFVPDAIEFMAQAKVVAIPTLSGGGIQIKTLDAIASGSKIVATSVALRGIDDFPKTVEVTNEPEKFAQLLKSAINSTENLSAVNDASEWLFQRQQNFLSELTMTI